MSTTLSWGIIGTGRIAGIFAHGVTQLQTGTLVVVGIRSQAATNTFGETWSIPHCYSRYEEVCWLNWAFDAFSFSDRRGDRTDE